jgi:hypothetical protein
VGRQPNRRHCARVRLLSRVAVTDAPERVVSRRDVAARWYSVRDRSSAVGGLVLSVRIGCARPGTRHGSSRRHHLIVPDPRDLPAHLQSGLSTAHGEPVVAHLGRNEQVRRGGADRGELVAVLRNRPDEAGPALRSLSLPPSPRRQGCRKGRTSADTRPLRHRVGPSGPDRGRRSPPLRRRCPIGRLRWRPGRPRRASAVHSGWLPDVVDPTRRDAAGSRLVTNRRRSVRASGSSFGINRLAAAVLASCGPRAGRGMMFHALVPPVSDEDLEPQRRSSAGPA